MARVAFIGLGVMGSPMAGYLVAIGHSVTAYNRTASRAEACVTQLGNAKAPIPAAAAEAADIVFSCVGNAADQLYRDVQAMGRRLQ